MKNISCFPQNFILRFKAHQSVGCEDSILQTQVVELARFSHVLTLTEAQLLTYAEQRKQQLSLEAKLFLFNAACRQR